MGVTFLPLLESCNCQEGYIQNMLLLTVELST